MTCKNCVHYELCSARSGTYPYEKNQNCNFYKDKSLIIELPCNYGERIYTIRERYDGKRHIQTHTTLTSQNALYFAEKIKEGTSFTSREAAEKALEVWV